MTRSVFLLLSLFALLAACASSEPAPEAPYPDAATLWGETDGVDAEDPGRPVARASTPGSALTDVELSVWRNPSFKRQFAESYMAESEVEPRVTAEERQTMLEVLDLISAEKLGEAARLLEKNRGPAASAVFDFTLANIAYQQDELDRAEQAYKVSVEKFPRFRRAWGNIGQIYFRRGEFAKAVNAFSRVVELGGANAITFGLLGVAHTRDGNYVSAESAFRMATLLDPNTTDWKIGLAETFFRQQRYADAATLFQGLIAENPDRADLWLAQGEAYAQLNQPLKAAENFEMVDQLGGASVQSLNNLGDIYSNQQLWDLAVRSYLRALELTSEAKPDRAIRAAKYLSVNGALEETRALVDGIEAHQGGRLEPAAHKDLLKIRARLAVAEGASEEEARVLEQIVQLDPTDGDALILLGQYHNKAGSPEKAVFYYERASSMEPFEADAKLRHAELLVRQGKYTEALPLLQRAQSLKPRQNVQEFLEQVQRATQAR